MRALCSVDGVACNGNHLLRQRRKALVTRIQSLLSNEVDKLKKLSTHLSSANDDDDEVEDEYTTTSSSSSSDEDEYSMHDDDEGVPKEFPRMDHRKDILRWLRHEVFGDIVTLESM